MVRSVPRRANSLIDALEAINPVEFDGCAWRIVREGRDPLRFSSSGGRWDDGTFDVLYTSLERQGAIEEMRFHLMRGQPVMPSRVKYKMFELQFRLDRALRLLDLNALNALGLETARYGRLSYQEKSDEYPLSQQIGEVAHFLEFDGLIVPSARYSCQNAVLFGGRLSPEALAIKCDHGLVDWGQ